MTETWRSLAALGKEDLAWVDDADRGGACRWEDLAVRQHACYRMAVGGGGEMTVGNRGAAEPMERGANITRLGQVGKPETTRRRWGLDVKNRGGATPVENGAGDDQIGRAHV